ncbi:DUF4190 domain-containing protein [Streptomyces crystallinus]|uniref:DUF4190 domain-containing protein n=1 Tax=Streptomyces crystallinus TaxID=68191 RepID=A0ABN1FFY3_9ACTN
MSDNHDQPSSGAEPVDPWAPPERKGAAGVPDASVPGASVPPGPSVPPVSLGKPDSSAGPVHDQPTVASMPGADTGAGAGSGAVPPPPAAPGGYGYPAGYPAYPGYGYGHPGWTGMGTPLNGFGTTALVLGILSVVLFCMWGLGVVLGILALIFGFLGRGRAKRGQATNGGQALAGVILGAVGIVVSGVFLGLMIWAVVNDEGGDDSYRYDDPFATSLVVREGAPTPPLP